MRNCAPGLSQYFAGRYRVTVGAQGKTFDPLRAVSGHFVRPFIRSLVFQERVSGDDLYLIVRGHIQRIMNQREGLSPCRRRLAQLRRMKRFAVGATQGQRADPFGIKRLPADGELRLLRVGRGADALAGELIRGIIIIPLFPLGDIELQAVGAGEVPRRAGDWNPHFLIDRLNIPVLS